MAETMESVELRALREENTRLRSEVAEQREIITGLRHQVAAIDAVRERAEAEVALLKRSLAMLGEAVPEGERIEGVAWKDGDAFCPQDNTHQESWCFVPFCEHDRGVGEHERRAVLVLPTEEGA